MERLSPHFDPNPGRSETKENELSEVLDLPLPENVGKHYILELYDCNHAKLNDEAFIRTIIANSAKIAGATLINLMTHRFEPHGLTGLALLAESHISIHTWPEIGYAAIDVFTCGQHTMPEKACQLLRKELLAKRYLIKSLDREIPQEIYQYNRIPCVK